MQRSGAMDAMENLSADLEFFTLYTTIDITQTGDYADDTQKDFESIMQVIGLRAQPVILSKPRARTQLENRGAPSLTGAGWTVNFAFEMAGVHTLDTLRAELDGIVLNGGTTDTTSTVNLEFTKSTDWGE